MKKSDFSGMKRRLDSIKDNLKWQEEHVEDLKKEILELENKLSNSKLSQLEQDFLTTQESFQKEVSKALSHCRQEMQEIGKKLVLSKIEEISERTGIPVHIRHNREFNMNAVYTPFSAKEKWPDIDFKMYEIVTNDSNFGGDRFVEGWYHSSVC